MSDILTLSLASATVYLIIRFIEMKYIDKDDKPIKLLMKDSMFVFLGVYSANFIIEQMGDMSQGSTISGGAVKTPAFTGDPAF